MLVRVEAFNLVRMKRKKNQIYIRKLNLTTLRIPEIANSMIARIDGWRKRLTFYFRFGFTIIKKRRTPKTIHLMICVTRKHTHDITKGESDSQQHFIKITSKNFWAFWLLLLLLFVTVLLNRQVPLMRFFFNAPYVKGKTNILFEKNRLLKISKILKRCKEYTSPVYSYVLCRLVLSSFSIASCGLNRIW